MSVREKSTIIRRDSFITVNCSVIYISIFLARLRCKNVLIGTPRIDDEYRTYYTYVAGDHDSRTRRPASADRTARRQFQANGQPVSRTQADDVDFCIG